MEDLISDSMVCWLASLPASQCLCICASMLYRYTYFPCSRRQFGLLGPSLLEIDHDERHEDGTLASSLAVRIVFNLMRLQKLVISLLITCFCTSIGY